MKCPKCGYNSFEYHDSCKKCANDLTGYKSTYGITAIVLPEEVRASKAEELMAQTALKNPVAEASETAVDMFSFDIDEAPAASSANDDPFNFDDEPIAAAKPGGSFSFDDSSNPKQAKAEEDAFADLLESTAQKDKEPASGDAGESDLGNFSWDDTPDDVAGSSAKPVEDDFNSLFGEQDDKK